MATEKSTKYDITKPAARAAATPNREPQWLEITGEPNVYLGFRKMPVPQGAPEGTKPVETWVVKYPCKAAASGRKEKSLGAHPSHHAATTALRAVLVELRSGRTVNDWTVTDLCEDYLRAMEAGEKLQDGLRATVRATKAQCVKAATALRKRMQRYILGGKHSRGEYKRDPIAGVRLDQLGKHEVVAWEARFTKEIANEKTGLANDRTWNREVQALRAPLNYGKDMRNLAALQDRSVWKDTLHKIDVDEEDFARDLKLTQADRDLIESNADDEFKPFLQMMRCLPLRPGAAAQLSTDHVDGRDLHVEFDKKHAGRKFVMTVSTAAFMQTLKARKVHTQLLTRAGGDAWTSGTWRAAFNKARDLSFPEGDKRREACMYSLRHAAITDLINANVPPTKVAFWAGTSVKEIEKTYMKHDVDENGLTGMEALDRKVA